MLGHFGLLLIESCFCEYHTFLENAMVAKCFQDLFLGCRSASKRVSLAEMLLLWFVENL